MNIKKYTTAQAAKYLLDKEIFHETSRKGSNMDKLRRWRTQRKGPEFVKLTTGAVYYTQTALDDYIKGICVSPTSE
jgi:hypothetical protein